MSAPAPGNLAQVAPDLATFVCGHVFRIERPINVIGFQDDDCFFAICGAEDCDLSDGHIVGWGHLVRRDPSIPGLAAPRQGTCWERDAPGAPWETAPCGADPAD